MVLEATAKAMFKGWLRSAALKADLLLGIVYWLTPASLNTFEKLLYLHAFLIPL